jgi:hypothetical protein
MRVEGMKLAWEMLRDRAAGIGGEDAGGGAITLSESLCASSASSRPQIFEKVVIRQRMG